MAPLTYKRVVVYRSGGPEVLTIVEDRLPTPSQGQARVKVRAADVSFSDVNIRRGRYPGAPHPPFTPGYAMVGEVDELAAGVTSPPVGRTVAALTFTGGYSQFICLPVEELVPVRADLDPAEAVCLVLNYVAAYQMLHRVARVTAGQTILVHGAAGGVGTAFLEVARLADLKVFGTASKPKHELIERLGATPIDYRAEDFVAKTLASTHGQGVDAAFDPMGSAHLTQTVNAVRGGGWVVAYGFYEVANRAGNVVLDVLSQYVRLALWSLPPQRKHVGFYDIRPLKAKHPDWFRSDLTGLMDLLADRKVKPVVAERLPLEAAAEAQDRVEHARVQGKLILMPNG